MDRLTCMEAFVRVAEAGSFSDAARTWGCSRGVVSKYVQQLEGHLGVPLFRRTTRSVSLTDAGRSHLERCQQIVGLVEESEAELREAHHAPRGPIRVTAPPGFVTMFHQSLIVDFLERFPEVTLELDLTHRMIDLVEERIDVAIRLTRPADSGLIARRLGPAPLVLVASPEYLARAGVPTHPAELAEHPALLDTNFRFHPRWPFRVDGEPLQVRVRGPVQVNDPLTIRDLARAGLGIGLVTRMIVEPELAAGSLVEVLPGTVDAGWSAYAVTSRRRQLSARTRAFISHLQTRLDLTAPRPG